MHLNNSLSCAPFLLHASGANISSMCSLLFKLVNL
uniref:Uncharacterized protein n=1 Tax=Rhizophora mucronata TaxID=61149 RepID=A0A2P2QZJ6_RHIMU